MFRRLIFLSALLYTVVHLSKNKAKGILIQPEAPSRRESEGSIPVLTLPVG